MGKSAVKGLGVSMAVCLAFLRTRGHGNAPQAQTKKGRGDWIRHTVSTTHIQGQRGTLRSLTPWHLALILTL